ncbi:MAG TPA: hypothetical protein VFE61_01745 [Candidatus Sulfotelmatobacter sp.]|jgi:hypothetical protein|nr:hypothetical protein [Candidatus Sulfotelmatobacter sp.]
MPWSSNHSFFANLWQRVPITITTTALLIAGWTYSQLSASPSPRSSSNAPAQDIPAPPKPLAGTAGINAQAPATTHGPLSGFRRVRVGPNEVDYVAEDVTVRLFTSRRTSQPVQPWNKQVEIGDDVTIRYFADKAPLAQSVTPALRKSK